MGKFVTDVEAAFIRMQANRVLRLSQKALAEGEVFHDLSQPTPVMSGYRAKIVHTPSPEGAAPSVHIWAKPGMLPPPGMDTQPASVVLTEAAELASELLAHPAKLWTQQGDHLEYVSDE